MEAEQWNWHNDNFSDPWVEYANLWRCQRAFGGASTIDAWTDYGYVWRLNEVYLWQLFQVAQTVKPRHSVWFAEFQLLLQRQVVCWIICRFVFRLVQLNIFITFRTRMVSISRAWDVWSLMRPIEFWTLVLRWRCIKFFVFCPRSVSQCCFRRPKLHELMNWSSKLCTQILFALALKSQKKQQLRVWNR